MAISTSGVSVPQLGQTIDASIYGNQNAPKPMTIADMLDINKKQLELSKSKETYEADVAGKKAESQRLQTEAQKAGIDLNMHTKNLSNGVYGGYLTDPDFLMGNSEKMVEKLKSARTFLEDNGLVPPNQGKGHDALLDLAKSKPSAAYQMIKNGVNQSGGTAEQFSQINRAPSAVSTGQGTQFVQTSPYQGATNNQFVQGQIPIGTKQVAQPGDNSGLEPNTEYLVGPQGQIQPIQPGTTQQGGVTPGQMNRPANQQGPVVTKLSPQTETNLELGNSLVNTSREQAGKAVQIESAANQAIQLSQVTDTGKGAQLWNALKGNYVGIPDFNYGNPSANFDILGHVLTNETNLLSQNPAYGAGKMGGTGGTQKQIEQAVQTAGKTDWNPNAIQYTSRYNRALAYGVQMFNHGVDQSQTISNRNPLYANDYQQKWNSNLNLDSIRLADAKRNAGIDPQGLTQITKELGGEKSERYKKAQEDLRVINNLATRGK
jgi:hypothetical protein